MRWSPPVQKDQPCVVALLPGSRRSEIDQHMPVLGATLQQVFGMAEGLLNYTRLDDPEDVVCTTQGHPMSDGDEVRIVDEDDRDLQRYREYSFR